MVYTPPKYPTEIPTILDLPDRVDFEDWLIAARYNELKKELRAALIELGTLPKGSYADVKTRLDAAAGGFTDRGDPAAWDFVVGDLTTDGTWRDLDLGSIVPAGAKAILLKLVLMDNVTSSFIQFKKNGHINDINTATTRTQVANINIDSNLIVACDDNRIIKYRTTAVTFSAIYLLIRGWWM